MFLPQIIAFRSYKIVLNLFEYKHDTSNQFCHQYPNYPKLKNIPAFYENAEKSWDKFELSQLFCSRAAIFFLADGDGTGVVQVLVTGRVYIVPEE
jgi:hypothetical protein